MGLVVAVHVDPAAFDERWLLATPDARPLHFLGERFYSTLEGVLEARLPRDAEAPERVLQERLLEELELTREAQERRAEALGALAKEVDAGKLVDLSQLALGLPPAPTPPPGEGRPSRPG